MIWRTDTMKKLSGIFMLTIAATVFISGCAPTTGPGRKPLNLTEKQKRDLIDYVSKLDSDTDDCKIAGVRLVNFCGCENVEPNCTLCPGGIQPSYANKIATEDTTCGDFANTVLTWDSQTCEIGETYLSVMAARCGCITADWPVSCVPAPRISIFGPRPSG